MKSAQMSFTIPNKDLKDRVAKKLKERGGTMKFLFISALEAYDRGDFEISLTPKSPSWSDDMMTEENEKNYIQAKKDLENGVNIISQEEIYRKYL